MMGRTLACWFSIQSVAPLDDHTQRWRTGIFSMREEDTRSLKNHGPLWRDEIDNGLKYPKTIIFNFLLIYKCISKRKNCSNRVNYKHIYLSSNIGSIRWPHAAIIAQRTGIYTIREEDTRSLKKIAGAAACGACHFAFLRWLKEAQGSPIKSPGVIPQN